MAETRKAACEAFDRALIRFEGKYPGAMERLRKDRDELLVFYDFPAPHWTHIRTTNPIESTFYGTAEDKTRQKWWLQRDHVGDGLQAIRNSAEALEGDEGI